MSKAAGKRPMIEDSRQSRGTKSKRPQVPHRAQQPTRGGHRPEMPLHTRFCSDGAYNLYQTRYHKRGITVEQGIDEHKVDPQFNAMIQARGWGALTIVPNGMANASLAREFLANMNDDDLELGFVKVRGVQVAFSPEVINKHYEIPDVWIDEYKERLVGIRATGRDPLEELRCSLVPGTDFRRLASNKIKDLRTTDFPEYLKVICRFIAARLAPKNDPTRFAEGDLELLYALIHNFPINVGQEIFDNLKKVQFSSNRTVGVPHLIRRLCLNARVPEFDSDERVQPGPLIKRDKTLAQEERKRKRTEEAAARGSVPAPPPPTPPPTTSTTAMPSTPLLPLTDAVQYRMANAQRNFLEAIMDKMNNLLTIEECREDGRPVPSRNLFARSSRPMSFDDDIEAAIAQAIDEEDDGADEGDGEDNDFDA